MKLETTINGKSYQYKKPFLGVPTKAQRIRQESDTLQNIEMAYGNRMTDGEFDERLKVIEGEILKLESEPVEQVKDQIKELNESRQQLMLAHRLGKEVFDDWWRMVTTIIENPTDDLRLENLAEHVTEGELQAVVARFFTLRTEDIQEASAIMTRRSAASS
jgi:hypothetical protein